MKGRTPDPAVTWQTSIGFGYYEQNAPMASYVEQLLHADDVRLYTWRIPEKPTTKQRKLTSAVAQVFEALAKMDPASVDVLGDTLGINKKIVRQAVNELRDQHRAIQSSFPKAIIRLSNL